MKVFKETGYMEQSAHFGWQNKDSALYGLREGYKNSADTLVEYVLEHGENPKILDTYVFPILFSNIIKTHLSKSSRKNATWRP